MISELRRQRHSENVRKANRIRGLEEFRKVRHMVDPARCNRCKHWFERNDFGIHYLKGERKSFTLCPKCRSDLADISPAPAEISPGSATPSGDKPEDSKPQVLLVVET